MVLNVETAFLRPWRSAFICYAFCWLAAEGAHGQVTFNPEFVTVKSRVSFVPGIKVVRGETHVIVPMFESYCPMGNVFKFNNGDIQVHDRRSSDGGKTWKAVGNVLSSSTYQYPEPDGEVVKFVGGKVSLDGEKINAIQRTGQPGLVEAQIARSNDNGLKWKEETARIHLPENYNEGILALNRKIVRSGDGSLLMNLWHRAENGIGRSVFVIRSTDRGKNWRYLSTIAFELTEGIRSEGFNETDLLVLPDGMIMSFMRSGTSYQGSLGSHNKNDPDAEMPFSYHKSTPVYMSKSIDGGKTWSNADPITEEFGVWPGSVLMDNGIIAVNYGRPGNWIMFTKDEGETWGPVIPFYNDLYPPDCSNYFALAEVAPNILLAVYARTDPNDHRRSEIVGTYFQVKRVED